MVALWQAVKGVFGSAREAESDDATRAANAEASRNDVLRVASVVRADLAALRTHAGSGPVNTALLRAAGHVDAFGRADDGHLYRAAEALAAVGRLVAPTGRPPCLFNPVHGPAEAEVEWVPPTSAGGADVGGGAGHFGGSAGGGRAGGPAGAGGFAGAGGSADGGAARAGAGGGGPRRVPACTADAARITSGQQPHLRLVPTDFGLKPYFAAGASYADWILGWYADGQDPYLTAHLLAGTELGASLPSRIQQRSGSGPRTFGSVHS